MDAQQQSRAEEIVLGMLADDEQGRPEVVTSLASLRSVFQSPLAGPTLCAPLLATPAEVAAIAVRQKAALRSADAYKNRDRTKTTAVGLVMCLNIGTDPPDAPPRVHPCAHLQCWIDPSKYTTQAALDAIGNALALQYEPLQPRAKYKLSLDPTVKDISKLASSLRRHAKDDRVLFHYNGHGVPRPTGNGEIWAFNDTYTQYVPVSPAELKSWVGTPALYVFDCSHAGALLPHFAAGPGAPSAPSASGTSGPCGQRMTGADARAQWNKAAAAAAAAAAAEPSVSKKPAQPSSPPAVASPVLLQRDESIVLCACRADESLPTTPDLPADVFTACLTTPLRMAVRWHAIRRGGSLVVPPQLLAAVDQIPGKQADKKTPLGELHWIYTSVCDTIAWSVLPRPMFLRLFRQDSLTAALFRNMLLAQRILTCYGCTPVSHPSLPASALHHPLWRCWDDAVESLLAQLPTLLGYSPYDLARMSALGLTSDLSQLGPQWSEMAPPVPPSDLVPAAAAPAPGIENGASQGQQQQTNDAASASANATSATAATAVASGIAAGPSRLLTRKLSDKRVKKANDALQAPSWLPSGLLESGADPLSLPIPPAASATADQRVRMLRSRLQGLLQVTSVGPAIGSAPSGLPSYSASHFFDEQLASFELWLRDASLQPARAHARLADCVLEFIGAASGATTSRGVGPALLAAGDSSTSSDLSVPPFALSLRQRLKLPATSTTSHRPLVSEVVGQAGGAEGETDAAGKGKPSTTATAAAGGGSRSIPLVPVLRLRAPDQLPILLQVLLAPNRRLRALQLLARFCDLGPEAVALALAIGILPYVTKLLQSSVAFLQQTKAGSTAASSDTAKNAAVIAAGLQELAPTLVFIWAKIHSSDPSTASELASSHAEMFLVDFLRRTTVARRTKAAALAEKERRRQEQFKAAESEAAQAAAAAAANSIIVSDPVTGAPMLVTSACSSAIGAPASSAPVVQGPVASGSAAPSPVLRGLASSKKLNSPTITSLIQNGLRSPTPPPPWLQAADGTAVKADQIASNAASAAPATSSTTAAAASAAGVGGKAVDTAVSAAAGPIVDGGEEVIVPADQTLAALFCLAKLANRSSTAADAIAAHPQAMETLAFLYESGDNGPAGTASSYSFDSPSISSSAQNDDGSVRQWALLVLGILCRRSAAARSQLLWPPSSSAGSKDDRMTRPSPDALDAPAAGTPPRQPGQRPQLWDPASPSPIRHDSAPTAAASTALSGAAVGSKAADAARDPIVLASSPPSIDSLLHSFVSSDDAGVRVAAVAAAGSVLSDSSQLEDRKALNGAAAASNDPSAPSAEPAARRRPSSASGAGSALSSPPLGGIAAAEARLAQLVAEYAQLVSANPSISADQVATAATKGSGPARERAPSASSLISAGSSKAATTSTAAAAVVGLERNASFRVMPSSSSSQQLSSSKALTRFQQSSSTVVSPLAAADLLMAELRGQSPLYLILRDNNDITSPSADDTISPRPSGAITSGYKGEDSSATSDGGDAPPAAVDTPSPSFLRAAWLAAYAVYSSHGCLPLSAHASEAKTFGLNPAIIGTGVMTSALISSSANSGKTVVDRAKAVRRRALLRLVADRLKRPLVPDAILSQQEAVVQQVQAAAAAAEAARQQHYHQAQLQYQQQFQQRQTVGLALSSSASSSASASTAAGGGGIARDNVHDSLAAGHGALPVAMTSQQIAAVTAASASDTKPLLQPAPPNEVSASFPPPPPAPTPSPPPLVIPSDVRFGSGASSAFASPIATAPVVLPSHGGGTSGHNSSNTSGTHAIGLPLSSTAGGGHPHSVASPEVLAKALAAASASSSSAAAASAGGGGADAEGGAPLTPAVIRHMQASGLIQGSPTGMSQAASGQQQAFTSPPRLMQPLQLQPGLGTLAPLPQPLTAEALTSMQLQYQQMQQHQQPSGVPPSFQMPLGPTAAFTAVSSQGSAMGPQLQAGQQHQQLLQAPVMVSLAQHRFPSVGSQPSVGGTGTASHGGSVGSAGSAGILTLAPTGGQVGLHFIPPLSATAAAARGPGGNFTGISANGGVPLARSASAPMIAVGSGGAPFAVASASPMSRKDTRGISAASVFSATYGIPTPHPSPGGSVVVVVAGGCGAGDVRGSGLQGSPAAVYPAQASPLQPTSEEMVSGPPPADFFAAALSANAAASSAATPTGGVGGSGGWSTRGRGSKTSRSGGGSGGSSTARKQRATSSLGQSPTPLASPATGSAAASASVVGLVSMVRNTSTGSLAGVGGGSSTRAGSIDVSGGSGSSSSTAPSPPPGPLLTVGRTAGGGNSAAAGGIPGLARRLLTPGRSSAPANAAAGSGGGDSSPHPTASGAATTRGSGGSIGSRASSIHSTTTLSTVGGGSGGSGNSLSAAVAGGAGAVASHPSPPTPQAVGVAADAAAPGVDGEGKPRAQSRVGFSPAGEASLQPPPPPPAPTAAELAAAAAAEAKRQALERLRAIKASLPEATAGAVTSFHQLCTAATLAAFARDGSADVRIEVMTSLSALTSNPLHAAGLAVVAAVTLLDFVTGGSLLLSALRLTAEEGQQQGSDGASTATPDKLGGGGASGSGTDGSGLGGLPKSDAGKAGGTPNKGLRLRLNLFSRLTGASSRNLNAPSSGAVAAASSGGSSPSARLSGSGGGLGRSASAMNLHSLRNLGGSSSGNIAGSEDRAGCDGEDEEVDNNAPYAYSGPGSPTADGSARGKNQRRGPSVLRDPSSLGFPGDLLPLSSITSGLHFLAGVYRSLQDGEEDPSLSTPSSNNPVSDLRGSWLLNDAGSGLPDPALTAAVREIGPRALLYLGVWVAMLAGTTDPLHSVARASRSTVRRVWAQALTVIAQDATGALPRKQRGGTPLLTGVAAPSASGAESSVVGSQLSSQQLVVSPAAAAKAFAEASVNHWAELLKALPLLDQLGLASHAVSRASVRFHQPQLPPHADNESTDPLSLSNLQRITRHKRLQLALAEAMVLGLTAYDDVTVKGVIEASADLWMRLQRYRSKLRGGGGGPQDSSRALLASHLALTASGQGARNLQLQQQQLQPLGLSPLLQHQLMMTSATSMTSLVNAAAGGAAAYGGKSSYNPANAWASGVGLDTLPLLQQQQRAQQLAVLQHSRQFVALPAPTGLPQPMVIPMQPLHIEHASYETSKAQASILFQAAALQAALQQQGANLQQQQQQQQQGPLLQAQLTLPLQQGGMLPGYPQGQPPRQQQQQQQQQQQRQDLNRTMSLDGPAGGGAGVSSAPGSFDLVPASLSTRHDIMMRDAPRNHQLQQQQQQMMLLQQQQAHQQQMAAAFAAQQQALLQAQAQVQAQDAQPMVVGRTGGLSASRSSALITSAGGTGGPLQLASSAGASAALARSQPRSMPAAQMPASNALSPSLNPRRLQHPPMPPQLHGLGQSAAPASASNLAAAASRSLQAQQQPLQLSVGSLGASIGAGGSKRGRVPSGYYASSVSASASKDAQVSAALLANDPGLLSASYTDDATAMAKAVAAVDGKASLAADGSTRRGQSMDAGGTRATRGSSTGITLGTASTAATALAANLRSAGAAAAAVAATSADPSAAAAQPLRDGLARLPQPAPLSSVAPPITEPTAVQLQAAPAAASTVMQLLSPTGPSFAQHPSSSGGPPSASAAAVESPTFLPPGSSPQVSSGPSPGSSAAATAGAVVYDPYTNAGQLQQPPQSAFPFPHQQRQDSAYPLPSPMVLPQPVMTLPPPLPGPSPSAAVTTLPTGPLTVVPAGPPPLAEGALDADLRAAASVTPRLSASLLARAASSTVRLARQAARKMTQRCVIDTGSPLTSSLLFHPWADLLLVADHADGLSLWSIDDGSHVARWRAIPGLHSATISTAAGGGVGRTVGGLHGSTSLHRSVLWSHAWTDVLRSGLGGGSSVLSTVGSSASGGGLPLSYGSLTSLSTATAVATPYGTAAAAAASPSLLRASTAANLGSMLSIGRSSGGGGGATIGGGGGSRSGNGHSRPGLPAAFGGGSKAAAAGAGGGASALPPLSPRLGPGSRGGGGGGGGINMSPRLAAVTATEVAAAAGAGLEPLSLGSSGGGGTIGRGSSGNSGLGLPAASASPPTAFSRLTSPPVRVTSLSWIDEHDACHLLTASDDGVVRIWDGLAISASAHRKKMEASADAAGGGGGGGGDGKQRRRSASSATDMPSGAGAGQPHRRASGASSDVGNVMDGDLDDHHAMTSQPDAPPRLDAFNAFPEVAGGALSGSDVSGGGIGGGACAGLLTHYLPSTTTLVAGGGRAQYLRLWDMASHRCTDIIPFTSGSGVGAGADVGYATTLSSPWPGTHMVVVGTSSGAVQVLDTRLPSPNAVAASLREHRKWVVSACQPRSGSVHSLVTGSLLADVRFWDLRRPSSSVHSVAAHATPGMTSLVAHYFAPLLATGTRKQAARLFSNSGDVIKDITYHEGFLGQRIGPVSALAFHPYRLYLAVGALDSLVSVYGGGPVGNGAGAGRGGGGGLGGGGDGASERGGGGQD